MTIICTIVSSCIVKYLKGKKSEIVLALLDNLKSKNSWSMRLACIRKFLIRNLLQVPMSIIMCIRTEKKNPNYEMVYSPFRCHLLHKS